jgi:hypothetical protein
LASGRRSGRPLLLGAPVLAGIAPGGTDLLRVGALALLALLVLIGPVIIVLLTSLTRPRPCAFRRLG